MKFLCDQMLGTLATWLRLCGFDTFYANAEINDDELLRIAAKDNRLFITRDKQLLERGKKNRLHMIEIRSTNLDEQLHHVLRGIPIDKTAVLTRCSLCNMVLDDISKDSVKEKVPEKVFVHHDAFWFCPRCKKIYWKGSHYDKIVRKIDEIQKRHH